MSQCFSLCFTTASTAFRHIASCILPLVSQRIPRNIPTQFADFSFCAVCFTPFVIAADSNADAQAQHEGTKKQNTGRFYSFCRFFSQCLNAPNNECNRSQKHRKKSNNRQQCLHSPASLICDNAIIFPKSSNVNQTIHGLIINCHNM